jgi:ABC-type dipeptide/oligopeptide/nickel transport system ATPase subunit
VALARALVTGPALLVADEALSSLDPSLRAQMANLLASLRATMGLACILVTHDLRLAAHLCDTIAVMAEGMLVDLTPADQLVAAAAPHPQTRALLAAERGG